MVLFGLFMLGGYIYLVYTVNELNLKFCVIIFAMFMLVVYVDKYLRKYKGMQYEILRLTNENDTLKERRENLKNQIVNLESIVDVLSYLEKLKKFVIEENLIKSKCDIDFLFLSYKYDEKKPLDELINDVIEWGYNNDELDDFYDEHWDELKYSDSVILLQICNMNHNVACTTFQLFRHNSKNKYYYKIKSDGDFADSIDTFGYFDVLENQDDESIIDYFKSVCNIAYDKDGELTAYDLDDVSIEFFCPI